MFYRLINKFFPAKKNKLFPRLLASTSIDETINPLHEYRQFIDSLTRWEDCFALLGTAEGINAHVNIYIKDWVYTARHYNNKFVKKVIVQKYHELELISASQALHIKMKL
jgi:hypothetical protein